MLVNGIPASLTIAQSILESGWGRSGLTLKANALFGIKADKNWRGKVYSAETQECYDGINIVTITAMFRAYNNWAESVSDHTALLTGAARYRDVIGKTDYKVSCRAIKKAGYATDPDYAEKLINIIETYALQKYDALVMNLTPAPTGSVNLLLGERIYRPKAENLKGNWYIQMPDIGGIKIKLRDILSMAEYTVGWDAKTETVTALHKII
jgi:hypothetical protein